MFTLTPLSLVTTRPNSLVLRTVLFAVSSYALTDVYNAQFLSIEKTTSLAEPVNHELLASMRSGAAGQFTGVPARPAHENDAIPKIAPKWLKHDRQVS